jgi:hypothetical protein
MREWPKEGRGFFRPTVFYQKGVVMNQDMNMGMMLCMLAGVLFSLVILVLVIVQTVLQAKILQGVRRITEKTGPASPQN